jgi:hypothetical protein
MLQVTIIDLYIYVTNLIQNEIKLIIILMNKFNY